MKENKNYLQVVDIDTLDTEEKCREAKVYLENFIRRSSFFTCVCVYWAFNFGLNAAQINDPTVRGVSIGLGALSYIIGGDCYLRKKEAQYEIQEVEIQRRKVISKMYGFDRRW